MVDNEKIMIEKEEAEYYFIRKEDGTGGYLNKKFVTEGNTETIQTNNDLNEVVAPQN